MTTTLQLCLMLLCLVGVTACNSAPSGDPIAAVATATTAPASATVAATTATTAPTETATLEPSATPEPTQTATATTEPTATATPEPTNTPTPEATATPAVEIEPLALQVDLPGIAHEYQRLNNCGPVSTSMALSYYGSTLTQYDIAPIVKGGPTDTNASPQELSRFIQEQGFSAPVQYNGNSDVVRALLSNGIPVIVEQWLERPDDELTAHYRLVRGYDSTAGTLLVNDSYVGPNLRYSEADFDRWWIAFNRVYIPVYRPEQEALVQAIIGASYQNDELMWQEAADRATTELETNDNMYSWYNLGEARLRLGDVEGAIAAFESSLAFGFPVRYPWYVFAHLEAFNTAGQPQRVLDVTANYTAANVEEIHYQRGVALEALGRPDEALAEYRTAATLNARMQPAADAIARLGG